MVPEVASSTRVPPTRARSMSEFVGAPGTGIGAKVGSTLPVSLWRFRSKRTTWPGGGVVAEDLGVGQRVDVIGGRPADGLGLEDDARRRGGLGRRLALGQRLEEVRLGREAPRDAGEHLVAAAVAGVGERDALRRGDRRRLAGLERRRCPRRAGAAQRRVAGDDRDDRGADDRLGGAQPAGDAAAPNRWSRRTPTSRGGRRGRVEPSVELLRSRCWCWS